MTTTHTDAMSIVQSMYDLIDRQQWAEHESLASNDFRSVLGSRDPMSFAAWQERVRHIYAAFPDGRHKLDFYHVEGGRILTVGRFEGTHMGTFIDRTATGRTISASVIHLDRVVDGKVVEHVAQLDIQGLLEQIGPRLSS